MTKTRLSLVALLSVVALGAAACGSGSSSNSGGSSSGSGAVPTDAVATVAGKPITRADLDDLLKTAEVQYKQNKQSFPKAGTAEYQALQQQAAVYLVTQEEYEQQAAILGIKISDADVDKGLDQLVKQRFSGSRKKFDDYLKSSGFTLAQFRTGERRQILGTRITKAVTKGVKVTDAEVKAYYATNKTSTYTTPAQRRVRHILVALNAKGIGVSKKGLADTKVDFAKSKALADRLYTQLVNGGNFVALVKKYSQDPGSKTKGGEYTDVKGTFVKEFEASAFSLKIHQVSKPVKSQFGYHLIEALGPVKPGKTKTFDEVKKSIRTTLLQNKQQEALRAWAESLGKKYKGKVKYAAGFEPPATTTTATTTTSQ
jgi:parvulin-like peptidyl-prolyl isomerase